MAAPAYHEDFTTDKNGNWEFHVRKVSTWLHIEVVPPAGYQTPNRQSVEIGSGQTRTNIVFRVQKTEEQSK